MSVGVSVVKNIELVEVGEEWAASTGPVTFTPEHLVAALAAFDDPAVRTPIVKLGHKSVLNDGEPALGRIINPRLSEDGMTLLGDLAGVPTWLAEAMPTLYPRRSIEGRFGVKTQTGAEHDFMLTGVALLGAAYPAVITLEDVQLLMTAESIDDLDLVAASELSEDPVQGTEKGPDRLMFGKNKSNDVALSVAVDDVRRAFYDSLKGDDDWYMWIREMQIDPAQLIVSDDRDDSLYRVSYTVSGEEVTFGEPIQVEVIYQDKTVAASEGSGRIVYSTKEESRPAKDRSNDLLPIEDSPMTADQLKAIGLAEDATQEQIDAKLAALAELAAKAATASDTSPAGDGDGEGEGEGGGGETPASTPPGSAPVVVPQGQEGQDDTTPKTVLVDASAWDEMQQFRQQAQARFKVEEDREKDAFIAAALADGKFTPAVKGDWRKALDTNYEATKATIEALPKGSVSLSEVGHGGTGEEVDASQAEYAAEYLTPAERARISSFYSGQEA